MYKKAGIDFDVATFKDFENIADIDMFERARLFNDFMRYSKEKGWLNYSMMSYSGCKAELRLDTPLNEGNLVNLISNDYLGFTNHPKVIEAAVEGLRKFGTGAGASPLIGGYAAYHKELEDKICNFFSRESGSAIIYTTGYTANSSTLQCLLQKEDIAIADMAVHASVFEGFAFTNSKRFVHNNMEHLERILKDAQHKYRTKLVAIDGVYSQDGDLANLKDVLFLTHKYGGYLLIDDAHGIGVMGKTGRGVGELNNLLDKIDIMTGTLSKTFGSVGGYVVSDPEMIEFLKVQSRQQVFSVTAPPTVTGITKAIDLIDEEPQWLDKLWENINYLKKGLLGLNLNIGITQSAVIPVKIGDPHRTAIIAQELLKLGIYANPIVYPGVAKKDARIRMAVMATHSFDDLDKVLEAFNKLKPIITGEEVEV